MKRITLITVLFLTYLAGLAQVVVRNTDGSKSIWVEDMRRNRSYQIEFVAFMMIKNRFDVNTQRQTNGLNVIVSNEDPVTKKERYDDENHYIRSDIGFIGKHINEEGNREFILMESPHAETILNLEFFSNDPKAMCIKVRKYDSNKSILEMTVLKKVTIRNRDEVSKILEMVQKYYNSGTIYTRDLDGNTTIYKTVDDPPRFPDGEAALMKFLSSHIQYPPAAMEKKISGKVVVQFVIEADGSIGKVKVVRSIDPDLDNEAIRVVQLLPNFIPGRLNGVPVSVWYTLPISFKLTSDKQ